VQVLGVSSPPPKSVRPAIAAVAILNITMSQMALSSGAPDRSAPKEYFDARYVSEGDPWRVKTSWYERRKYALTLAALPREHYQHGLELGCAFGAMSAMLAGRCARLTALDASERAIARARAQHGDLRGVEFREAVLPGEMPDVSVDLLMASELLNYLSLKDLDDLLDRVVAAVRPGGDVVIVHWFTRNPLQYDGLNVHAHVRSRAELHHVVAHEDEAFVLDVLRRE
jgi:SAM-dependent methyltransferase